MTLLIWLVAVYLSGLLSLLAAARATRLRRALGDSELHWTEAARIRWESRGGQVLGAVISMACAAALGAEALRDALGVDPLVGAPLSVVAAGAGVLTARRRLARADPRPRPGWVDRVAGGFARLLLFTALPPLVVTFLLTPWEWGAQVAVALGAGALVWTGIIVGGSTRLLLLLRVARPADAATDARVREIARAAGREPGRVVVVRSAMANAAVLPVPGDVILFRAVFDALGESELDAVLAHEAGHLAEPQRSAWLRAVPGYVALALGVLPALVDGFGLAAIPVALVATLAAALLVRRRARRLETCADAHVRAGGDAERAAFASGLEALYRHNRVPAVLGARGTHPDLYDRIVAMGETPPFARPEPPSRWRSGIGVLIAALVVLVVDVLGSVAVVVVVHLTGATAALPPG